MWIFKVGVVGAGFMGGGIAQVITYSGLPVVMKDIDQKQLDLARHTVEGIYQKRVDQGKMTAGQMQEKLGLIEYSLGYDGFSDVDLVIEAVPEVMKIKQAVFKELDGICGPDTIFASNTSALSITEMGSVTGRPNKMIGLHFFSPAHVMKLVEVIPTKQTDQDTTDTVEQFAQELRKIPVIVQECPGFLVNRLLMAYFNENVAALEEGAMTVQEADEALGKGGFGWPMGPFFLMDMVGVDVAAHTGETMYEPYKTRLKPTTLYQKMLEAKRLGEKSGVGFYIYNKPDAEPIDSFVKRFQDLGEFQRGQGAFSVDRVMMPLLNEAAFCVQENIANVNDIDMAAIAGIGMQINKDGELVRMGPLEYMDEQGLDLIVEKMEALEKEFGPRFHPANILYQKVKAGDLGKKTGRGFKEYA